MADCSNQGTSGILNEEVQGDNSTQPVQPIIR